MARERMRKSVELILHVHLQSVERDEMSEEADGIRHSRTHSAHIVMVRGE